MKKSTEFIKKYGLRHEKITSEKIKEILKAQGFKTKEYRKNNCTEETDELLKLFGCIDLSRHVNGFTYIDDYENKVVFYVKGLNEDDLIRVLLHEEGHIFLDHPFKNGIFENSDTQKEYEANKFAEEVMQYHSRLRNKICACFLAVLLSVTAVCVYNSRKNDDLNTPPVPKQHQNIITEDTTSPAAEDEASGETTTVYIVGTGDKYHEKDCYIVKNRSDAKAVDRNDAIEFGKTPCEICNPN